MSFGLKSQPCSVKRGLEVVRIINEKYGVFDIVSPAKFSQKYFGKSGCRGGKQPKVEQSVRFWISSSVQPVLLIVDANHCLVNRNLIRIFPASRL